jgi:hypothetical protein
LSWLDRIRSGRAANSTASRHRLISGDGNYGIACVGESNYTPALLGAAGVDRRASGPIEAFVRVRVACEPDNAYDRHAVVILSEAGRKLAYLAREDARDLGPQIARWTRDHGAVWCNARIGGRQVGGRGWRVGIWLDYAP